MSEKGVRSRFPLGLSQLGGALGGALGAPGAVGTAPASRAPGNELLRPQRLLYDSAREAARGAPPSGVGMDSAAVRLRMVQRLRATGVANEPVLAAFAAVPRHLFVDSALVAQAYEDTSLPIGWEQTISKPSVVARMLGLLFEGRSARAAGNLGRTLEIGTGCGYQTALLALLSRRVLSMERLKPLHDKAREQLQDWRGQDIRLVFGDGRLGHAPNAPYDTIIAAAGGGDLPVVWLEQLADAGRLIAPMWSAAQGSQVLVVVDKHEGVCTRKSFDAVHFVPLKSGTA